MSVRSTAATASRLPNKGLPPTTAAEFSARLAALQAHWRGERDFWARVERAQTGSTRERSAARATQSAYTAALQDLDAVLSGRALPERISG